MRGFWTIPSAVVTRSTRPQEIVQFRVQYRYSAKDGTQEPVETYDIDNTQTNDGTYYVYKTEVPKIMKSLRTSKKFTKNVTADNKTYLEFGAGTDSTSDEVIYPTAEIVGIGLQNLSNLNLNYSFDVNK